LSGLTRANYWVAFFPLHLRNAIFTIRYRMPSSYRSGNMHMNTLMLKPTIAMPTGRIFSTGTTIKLNRAYGCNPLSVRVNVRTLSLSLLPAGKLYLSYRNNCNKFPSPGFFKFLERLPLFGLGLPTFRPYKNYIPKLSWRLLIVLGNE
jgi:hypothetical protein